MCIFRHHCLYFEFKCSKRIAGYLFIMREHHASQLQVNNKLVHASHAYIELWTHAGSLENTREAKELLAAHRELLWLLVCFPNFPSASTSPSTHS